MNPWQVLGVSQQASPDEIKSAYRRLASKNHPDKGGDTKKFQEIQQAYEQLTNPNYSNPGAQSHGPGFGPRPSGNPFAGGNPFSGFEDLFRHAGFGFHSQRPPEPRGNQDVTVEMAFPLKDFVTGNTYEVNVNLPDRQQTVKVVLKPEHKPGMRLKFPEMGVRANSDFPAGDLYVIVRQQPDPKWDRQGDDLWTQIEIDALEAMIGCVKPIETLDDTILDVTIPAGSQPTTTLRVRGKGMLVGRNNLKGDLLIRLKITIPELKEADLNKSVTQLYHERHNRNN